MSGYTTTPNFGLYKPIVNGDDSQWGAHLNSNADIIDNVLTTQFLPVAGGTVNGPFTVNGNFTVNNISAGGNVAFYCGGGSMHVHSDIWNPTISFRIDSAGNSGFGQAFRTLRGNSLRWQMQLGNGDVESGTGNTGCNFVLQNYADDGVTLLGTPLSISRATGAVTVGGPLTINTLSPQAAITASSDVHLQRYLFVGEGASASLLNYIAMNVTGAGDAQTTLIKAKNRNASITVMSQSGGIQSTRWAMVLGDNIAETGSNVGCNFALRNYADDGTTQLGTPLAINRATGGISMASLLASTSYANDAAAATGGVTVGQLYRNGSQVMIRVT